MGQAPCLTGAWGRTGCLSTKPSSATTSPMGTLANPALPGRRLLSCTMGRVAPVLPGDQQGSENVGLGRLWGDLFSCSRDDQGLWGTVSTATHSTEIRVSVSTHRADVLRDPLLQPQACGRPGQPRPLLAPLQLLPGGRPSASHSKGTWNWPGPASEDPIVGL
jgi:hypothetical protein